MGIDNFVPDSFDSYFKVCPNKQYQFNNHFGYNNNCCGGGNSYNNYNGYGANINRNYLNGTTLAPQLGNDTLTKGNLTYTPIKKKTNVLGVIFGVLGATALIAGAAALLSRGKSKAAGKVVKAAEDTVKKDGIFKKMGKAITGFFGKGKDAVEKPVGDAVKKDGIFKRMGKTITGFFGKGKGAAPVTEADPEAVKAVKGLLDRPDSAVLALPAPAPSKHEKGLEKLAKAAEGTRGEGVIELPGKVLDTVSSAPAGVSEKTEKVVKAFTPPVLSGEDIKNIPVDHSKKIGLADIFGGEKRGYGESITLDEAIARGKEIAEGKK